MRSILVVSKGQEPFREIRSCLPSGYRIVNAPSTQAALDMLGKKRFDSVFLDIGLLQEAVEGDQYRSTLEPFWRMYPTIKIIIMSPQEMIREAVRAVKAGASDYVTYPIVAEEVKLITETAMESTIVQSELEYLRDQFWEPEILEIVQTKNSKMKKVYDKIRSVAPTKSTVLLMGETGTGKGVLANLIHQHSNRRNVQFISVHCGAIPDTLLESELFGHEKGAFTGAVKRKLGKFEIAS
ncbi:MAG: sigma 54-interacting transcriptional regulator, partial [Desulfobacteraceae bacterium]